MRLPAFHRKPGRVKIYEPELRGRGKEKINDIMILLRKVVDGDITNDQMTGEFYLQLNGYNEPVALSNLSTGMKSFVILKMLLEKECMRLNKMAAAVYMTCQGTLFFLSGEEFARTKDGHDNTFRAPIALNRLDWNKAWENQELVHYYQGLIALRKQIPGLCDKSENSYKHIIDIWKEKDVVGFTVLNDEAARWSRIKIIYNAGESSYKEEISGDSWEILSDANDSWCWEKGICAEREIEAVPQSVLILGCK